MKKYRVTGVVGEGDFKVAVVDMVTANSVIEAEYKACELRKYTNVDSVREERLLQALHTEFGPNSSHKIKSWRWRTGKGVFLFLEDMETSHVFYALRTVWNHSVEYHASHMITGAKKYYTFQNPYYTKTYMSEARLMLFVELQSRQDLTLEMEQAIDKVKGLYGSPVFPEPK